MSFAKSANCSLLNLKYRLHFCNGNTACVTFSLGNPAPLHMNSLYKPALQFYSQLLPCVSCGRCLRQFPGSLPTMHADFPLIGCESIQPQTKAVLSTIVGSVPWNQTPPQRHKLILSFGSSISLVLPDEWSAEVWRGTFCWSYRGTYRLKIFLPSVSWQHLKQCRTINWKQYKSECKYHSHNISSTGVQSVNWVPTKGLIHCTFFA